MLYTHDLYWQRLILLDLSFFICFLEKLFGGESCLRILVEQDL